MRKPPVVTAIAAATSLSLVLMAPSAVAQSRGDNGHHGQHGPTVSGTYSTGAAQAWLPLPTTFVGDDLSSPTDATVVVDPSQPRQNYNGIGFSLDETSVSNLWKLTPAQRDRAIQLLVDPKRGAGFSRFRITIGSPDVIEHLPFWSEDDLPPGVTSDWDLKYFSIQHDLDLHIIDTIKLIQRYNPHAQFFASAWSAPAWMKTNDQFTGEVALVPGSTTEYYQVGQLRDDCINVFARYYAKFVQAYARYGIHIDALTLLNEPGMDVVYPAMSISIEQQQKLALAIKKTFAADRINAQLWVHDFNFYDWRNPDSTETKNYYRIFEDAPDGSITGAQVKAASDAVAFHPYWGDPSVMRDVFEHTGKPVELTETSDISPATVLSYFRLDASSYVTWAPATDQNGGTLHWTSSHDNDIDWNQVGATTTWPNRLVTVNTDTKTFTVRDELYLLGQFSKYLSSDDVRLESSATANGISNVVYEDSHDNFVAVVGNSNAVAKKVRVAVAGQSFVEKVPANSYATFRWRQQVPRTTFNHPPIFGNIDDVNADQYETTQIQLAATDFDGDQLAYYADDLPDGVTVDGTTGVVTITPTTASPEDLTFRVTDGQASDHVTIHVNVVAHGAPVGSKIEAEAYTAENGWVDGGANFVENNASDSGGKDVGWTAAGNWLRYRVDVAQAGAYDLELRVANGTGAPVPNAITIRDSGGAVLSTVSVPDTGGWAAWQSVHTTVTLPAGDQDITVYCETWGFNLDYLRLTGPTGA